MQPSLALCLITTFKDQPKAQALADSLKEYVDEVVITVADVRGDFEWNDDFSAARTFNFAQAKSDWILWLDADDTLEGAENLRDLLKSAEENKVEHIFVKYEYAFDENGNCIDEHWKANLLKNNGHFKWAGAIHEDPIQVRPAKVSRTEDIKRIHHTNGERTKESYARNLRILLKEVEKNPGEPRNYFYLGRTYVSTGEFDKAIECLEKYLTLSGWDEERYEARLLIGQCLFLSGQEDDALQVYNDAILERETYPDAYIQKGMVYLKKYEWEKAFYNLRTSLRMQTPGGSTYFNPLRYTRDTYTAMATALMNMGKLDDAHNAILNALRADNKNQQTLEVYSLIKYLKNKYDTAKKFFDIAKYLKDEKKIQRLLATVPPELQDNALILSLRNTFAPAKVWPKNSIAVYCGQTVEPWTPENLKQGIGGSETAVIELTKRLAKLGWNVTVFNECNAPSEGLEFDGVKYQNYWTFNTKDEFDVLWVWRLPEMFDYDLQARMKLLDLHDVMTPQDLTKERVEKIDKIFVKTNYHRSLYPQVPDDKFTIIGNGIDLKRFDKKVKKEPFRFAYTSTPNRGLDLLLEFIWPKIKAALPEATLHTYYGWQTFYKLEKNNPERMKWMKKVQELMKQPGVVEHGRVGQDELAEDLLKTSFWLYPTYFPEIDCITAKEMQAAGVIPITSGYAALEESQHIGIKVPGDVYDPEWQERYIKAVITAEEEFETEPFDASVFSWDTVALKWHSELYEAEDNANEESKEAA